MPRSPICSLWDNPLNGIITHLTAKCGWNVHDCVIVNIISLSNDRNIPRNTAALTDDRYFWSSNAQNQTFTSDFKQMIVAPTHYTIRTHQGGQSSNHMKSWVVEASSDDEQWEVIDRRENDANLNGQYLVHSFEIAAVRLA
jgi:hypothetical protein